MEPSIEKAQHTLEYLSSDEDTMSIYWERERSLHERVNMLNSAKKRGRIEVAKALLDILDDETMATRAGLTIDEVIKLRNEFGN